MKKAVLKQIKDAAAKMPPVFKPTRVPVTGAEILRLHAAHAKRNNITDPKPPVDEHGKALDPDKTYIGPGRVRVNHESEMKRIYLKSGLDGVAQYINDTVQEFEEKRQKAKQPTPVETM